MTNFTYNTCDVCSNKITFDIESGKIHNVKFEGGCYGNLRAIGKLVEGMDAKHVANILRGNECRNKNTSCADQLSKAIDEAINSL